MITLGKKFEMPKELDEFVTPAEAQDKSQKHAKKLVEEALGRLEVGNEGEAARLLLGVVLMVVTPLSGLGDQAQSETAGTPSRSSPSSPAGPLSFISEHEHNRERFVKC